MTIQTITRPQPPPRIATPATGLEDMREKALIATAASRPGLEDAEKEMIRAQRKTVLIATPAIRISDKAFRISADLQSNRHKTHSFATTGPAQILIETSAIRNRRKPRRINHIRISNRDKTPRFVPPRPQPALSRLATGHLPLPF